MTFFPTGCGLNKKPSSYYCDFLNKTSTSIYSVNFLEGKWKIQDGMNFLRGDGRINRILKLFFSHIIIVNVKYGDWFCNLGIDFPIPPFNRGKVKNKMKLCCINALTLKILQINLIKLGMKWKLELSRNFWDVGHGFYSANVFHNGWRNKPCLLLWGLPFLGKRWDTTKMNWVTQKFHLMVNNRWKVILKNRGKERLILPRLKIPFA